MRAVFADTVYWGAILHPQDQYRSEALRAREALGETHVVTTDEVLIELLNGLAERGPRLRTVAASAVSRILEEEGVTVHPQTRESFLAGLRLYEKRLDKGYSLVDCVSMNTMRRAGITDVLTSDYHFAQEGFKVLFR